LLDYIDHICILSGFAVEISLQFNTCMAEASSQDHTDGLNVPGDLHVQEFEDFKGDETERRTEDHDPEQPSNTGDLQDHLGPRR